ncbi:CvpA family protein [Paucihalobacter ruber]|uniref:CvpA family protein n=2 Tax=Paucihalobacter ruber TaxID=2567861 RepID=A0A506PPA9_9FLAO|nr:CvpA family protein [Paucihalobacter ruber]
MAVIDIVLGVLLLFGLVRGLMKGLFVEIASLLALIFGIYGAIHFSNYAAELLSSKFDWDEQYIKIAAFAITFVIIVLVISLVGKALTKLADFAALGWINKLLGAVFGLLKMALICSVILIVLDRMNIDVAPNQDDETSVLYQPVYNLANQLFPQVLPELEDLLPSNEEV